MNVSSIKNLRDFIILIAVINTLVIILSYLPIPNEMRFMLYIIYIICIIQNIILLIYCIIESKYLNNIINEYNKLNNIRTKIRSLRHNDCDYNENIKNLQNCIIDIYEYILNIFALNTKCDEHDEIKCDTCRQAMIDGERQYLHKKYYQNYNLYKKEDS